MKLEDLRGWMKGEHAVVVACGPSAIKVPQWRYAAHWTIAVNRSVTHCEPDFAVCVEPAGDECWKVVWAQSPLFVFTVNPHAHPRAVGMSKNVHQVLDPESVKDLRLGQCTFWAIAAAIVLGFERIGVIGLDLDGRQWKAPGMRIACENAYGKLVEQAQSRGQSIVNLNKSSKLAAIKYGSWSSIEMKRTAKK